jgi:hypothetical protein
MKIDNHFLMASHNITIPFLLLFLFLMSCCSNLQISNRLIPDTKSPEQIVELYQKSFGTPRMDEIGPYTTANFRDNMPVTVWVNKTWNQLKQFGYEKVDFKLLDVEYNDLKDHAKVTIATKINTEACTATQKEIYLLIKDGGYWLIDDLIITDEVVDDEVFEL